MIYFLTAVLVILLFVLAAVCLRIKILLNHLEEMIETAADGSFLEHEYSEKQWSRLESKMYRYLMAGETARLQIQGEKDKIKTLVSDISHQTKTPLSNIVLYIQLLKEAPELSAQSKNLAEQMEHQAEKLSFLIRSLVKTSRLENGILKMRPKRNQIALLFAGLDFTAQAREKKIALSIGRAENLYACFDRKWTLEALSNILDNAIKYTPEGGSVCVTAKGYEMFVRIDITDTGIGMSEEETAKVFTRFYRSPRVAEEMGVGIGLYLAREIISGQNGYVKVTSKQGNGSVFSIFLPQINETLSKL